MASILRTSKFIRHFVSLARSIVISNRQEVDVSLLQRSQNLVGIFPSNFSATSYLQVNSQLERTVRRLDEDARRTGRISVKEIEEALHEIRNSKKATTSQSLMVIRCCGNLVPEETPERRTQLVEEIWKTLESLGVLLDISHYNALLKVYLENEHKFSPTEFLAKLEKKGVEPNRVTYQRLISGYCQMGDIAGATKILEYMKEKQLPVSEGVFNALILGHSQADDMESAEGMLAVMKQASLEPSCETYTTLMCGYARRGDKAALERLIKDCKLKDILISDRDVLEVAYTAAINGHDQLVDEILGNIRHMIGYNQDAVNVILRLLTKGKDEVAYKVFQTMTSSLKTDNSQNMSGHILIKQFVKSNKSVESIVALCERLEKDGHTSLGLYIAIEFSFNHGNVDMTLKLLKAYKEKGEKIRNHYFWPSLCSAGKANDIKTMNNILKKMVEEFDTPPISATIIDYYLPFVKSRSVDETLQTLLECGVRRGQAVRALVGHLICVKKLKEAAELAYQHAGLNLRPPMMHRILADALAQTGDVASVVRLVHVFSFSRPMDSVDAGEEKQTEEDEEFTTGTETSSRFLINVAYNKQTRENITAVLREMVSLGLNITRSCAETVENELQGKELTTEISEMLAKLSSGELTPSVIKASPSNVGAKPISRSPLALERIKERMIAKNEPVENLININRSLFQAYCFDDDLDNALRIQKEWTEELKQELTPGWWAQLLALYCTKGDLEGAKHCLDQVKTQELFELDGTKIVKLAKLYIENNQIDEALNLMESVKPRDEENSFYTRAACFQALTATADTTKNPEQVKRVFQAMFNRKYIDATNVNLGPIIKAYLLNDDVMGALKEFEHCVKHYRATPWKNEIATRLIEKEDAANLQTLVDLSTEVHGEINSLYDLVLSFVECGRIRQARKILETPGLVMRNLRLQTACERYKNEGRVEPLEGLVEATKDLHTIDRSEIYYHLLDTYCQADNLDKALGLWTQMQDEDVQVSDEFLVKLGTFLQSKGQKVPFAIPKLAAPLKIENESLSEPSRKQTTQLSSALRTALNAKDEVKALQIKERIEKRNESLSRNDVTKLLEVLIEKNKLEEATNLVLSLKDDRMPVIRTLNYFINRLSLAGELDLMKRVGDHLTEDLQKITSYTNRYMNCAVIAGKGKDELDKLEKNIENAATPEDVDAVAALFPLGGIYAFLQSSPSNLEPVTRIAEKYFNRGVVGPANCLCMYHMAEEQYDTGREVYQRYNLANSSRIMFTHALNAARSKNNPKIIEELMSMLENAPTITTEVRGLLYSNLINIYAKKGDFETALLKLDEALKSVPIEHIHSSTLSRLKMSVEEKNIPFKYTIPPRQKTKDSSASSSSSDEQPKQSMAAKH